MSRTLRVRTRPGWTTKDPANTPDNWLTPFEIDDNFLYLEDEVRQRVVVYQYAPGILIQSYSEFVRDGDDMYTLSKSVPLPYVTTGQGMTEGGKFIPGANSMNFTGENILEKLKPVDGDGSGLDADLLDNQHGSYYLEWSNFTNVPTTFPPGEHSHPLLEADVPATKVTDGHFRFMGIGGLILDHQAPVGSMVKVLVDHAVDLGSGDCTIVTSNNANINTYRGVDNICRIIEAGREFIFVKKSSGWRVS